MHGTFYSIFGLQWVHKPSLGRVNYPSSAVSENAADQLEFCGSSKAVVLSSRCGKVHGRSAELHFTWNGWEEHATSSKRVSTWGSCCGSGRSAERQPRSDGKPLGGGQGPYLPLICYRKSSIEECQDHSLPRFWISGHVCRKHLDFPTVN